MRVTNNMMTRNYLNNVNRNLSLYNKSGARLQSGRRFTKMSENVSDGTRALNVRTQMYKNEQYQENVLKCGESLDVAETNITSIEDILNSVHDQTIKALNGTNESASDIFSMDFSKLKNQIIEFANCKYNDMYVLGGTNNKDVPFTVNEDKNSPFYGDLYYNGINVNYIKEIDGEFYYAEPQLTEKKDANGDIIYDKNNEPVMTPFIQAEDENGNQLFDGNGDPVMIRAYKQAEDEDGYPLYDDDNNPVYFAKKVPNSENIYMDIGIGLSVKDGVVDPRSAFNMTVSGLDVLGYGTTEVKYFDINGVEHTEQMSNNAFELLDEMSKALDEKDFDRLSALNEHLKGTINDLVTEIADVGIRSKYLENHTGRLENEEDYMTEIQTNLEYIKDTDELINHKMLEYSWLLTLQYGGKVMPQSLMDYIR